MDPDFIPIGSKHMIKDLEKEININLGLQPVYNICSILYLNEYQENEGYECTIRIGNLEVSSNPRKNHKTYHLEKLAEGVATRNAYSELLKRNWKVDKGTRRRKKDSEKEKLVQSNIHKIAGVDTTKEGIPSLTSMGTDQLNVIYECGNYMSDEVFAKLFKDLVKEITKNVPNAHYTYTTRLHHEGGITGYKSVLDFNGRKFESLGLMLGEIQAEQSAAEVCLRTLRFIPSCTKGKFVIQPYQGGVSRLTQGINIDKPYAFISTVLFDVLEAFLDSRNMQRPRYYIKNTWSKLKSVEFTMNGEPEQNVDCMCSIYGKFFKAPSPHMLRIALQLCANEALDYFGFSNPQERMELRKMMRINRYDFSKGSKTAYNYRPSVCKGWIWSRFCRPDYYGDVDVESLLDSGILMNNLPGKEYMNELVRGEMERNPSFRSKELVELNDLSVAEADLNNPNLFLVGNSNFSIQVLFEDGKIHSSRRNATVDILPGHNIRKLRCKYRVSLPSLDIHLKAIDCHDLYYSNPPLPVVTSCGVVVLFHDYLSSPEDVFVLVTQRTSGTTFESKVHVLQGFLHTLIQANTSIVVTPEECTEGIDKWLYKEVKLLSEMTMDSLCELMSTCTKYDTRWNELLARGELIDPLKEVQDICLNELKRREDEGVSEEDQNGGVWELPQSDFVSRFDTIGIHLEESIFCGIRALAESAGIRIRIADIESSPTVDIAVESDKKHRGDVTRYYLWSERNQGKIYESNQDKAATKGYHMIRKAKVEHGMRMYRYASDERRYQYGDCFEQQHLMSNIEFVNAEGNRTKFVDTLKYRISEIQERRDKYGKGDASTVVAESDVQSTSNVVELPTITLPDDPKFESYKSSLQEYCKLKKLGSPRYKQVRNGRGGNKVSGTVSFGTYFFCAPTLADSRKESESLAAQEALIQLGYLKGDECEEPKPLTSIHLPGDVKFTSYKSSLQMLCVRENWGEPKYSFKKERRMVRGAVSCGKFMHVANELSTNMKESSARVAYEALRRYGYLKDVAFEDGYTPPVRRGGNIAVKEIVKGESVINDDGNDGNNVDSDIVVAKESGNEDETMNEDSNAVDLDIVVAKESGNEDETMNEDSNAVDPYSIIAEETVNDVDNNPEADEEDAGEKSEEPVKNDGGDGDMEETEEADKEDAGEMIEEPVKKDDGDADMEETEGNDGVAPDEAKEGNSIINGDDIAESDEEVIDGEKYKVVNEWARDDDIEIEKREKGNLKRKKSENQWAKDADVRKDELYMPLIYEEEVNKKTAKRKRYRMNRFNKRMKGDGKGAEPLNQWGQHKDVEGFKKDFVDRGLASLNQATQNRDDRGSRKSDIKEEDKKEEKDDGPDMSWKSYVHPDEKKRKGRKPRRTPPLPARDAYRQQCIWMRLDKAIDVCPMLMKISETSQFEEQLKKFVEDANKLLEGKGLTETVKTSLLPDV